MQQFAVVFYPKGDLELIQNFREKYDPMAQVISPHITLVDPFSGISEEIIKQHLAKIAQQTTAFPVRIKALFTSFDKYLFLLVDDGEKQVIDLHKKLYSGVLSGYLQKDISFMPHITIGSFMKNNTFNEILYAKALKEAEETNINLSCQLDEFSLIQGDGVNPAKTLQTFSLQQ